MSHVCSVHGAWRVSIVVLAVLAGGMPTIAQERAEQGRAVTLLVPGIAWDIEAKKGPWGRSLAERPGDSKWSGAIGALEAAGWKFGGVIQPRGATIALPDCLDVDGTSGKAAEATLFELRYSPSAQSDGLAYKAMELSACLRELCSFARVSKVNVVAHSAGGLAARVYLQSALPGMAYRHDVDRLITIGTPHLGSAMADSLGELLGTRVTALANKSPLIERLNLSLDLPADVRFASIVVRGFRADVGGEPDAYQELYDVDWLARLPLDFRTGGDEVVTTASQNLALSRAARKYETASGRPVQFVLARVVDPSLKDLSLAGRRVHITETFDPGIIDSTVRLLAEDAPFWTGFPSRESQAEWEAAQARQFAMGVIEMAAKEHSLREVTEVADIQLEHQGETDGLHRFAFTGTAYSKIKIVGRKLRTARVQGEIELRFDKFGRPIESYDRAKRVDEQEEAGRADR